MTASWSLPMAEGRPPLSLWRRFSLGWAVWLDARRLPYRIQSDDLTATLALADVGPDPKWDGVDLQFILRRVRRSVKHPILMRHRRCMRHGLLGFLYLRKAGYDPVLKFAIVGDSLKSSRVGAHCWVCLDGKPVISDREPGMVDVLEFPKAAAA